MPAFDVQVGVVAGANEGMDDFGPVGLSQPGESMFGYAWMANPVGFQEVAIDVGVFGVDVKNARAEFVDVVDGIDKLTDQVAGIPFDSNVLNLRIIEKALPHGGLTEHVVMHDGQVVRALWAMFEGEAH